MRILIVDDDSDSREILKAILQQAGYSSVVAVESAGEAFEFKDPVDLVLLDVQLPDIDGIEACRILKSQPRYQEVPVIIVTAKTDGMLINSAFNNGAVDYIRKPVEPVELKARIRLALQLKMEISRREAREKELMQMMGLLRELNLNLEQLSTVDSLTGIHNRRRFDLHLDEEWRRAKREAATISLLMIDIDFFKEFNDHYGHPLGDDCLRRVASALRGVVRRPGDLVSRYGGEEFAVVLPSTESIGALKVADQMRRAIESLHIPHARSKVNEFVTVSVGVATLQPPPNQKLESLLALADQALYSAKQAGRNRVEQRLHDSPPLRTLGGK